MAENNEKHRRREPWPTVPADGRGGFGVRVGDVIRSRYGLTTRTVVAIENDAVVLMGKTGIVQTVSKEDVANYWYKLNSKGQGGRG